MSDRIEIHWLKTTDSTNSDALRNMAQASDKEVWVAEFQTAGRGQKGNRWESRTGENITFSILFKPESIRPADQFVISEVCSCGVAMYLRDKGLSPKIKWPNDVYVGDRKICGMLIEHSIIGDKLSASIGGIGVNINQTVFDPSLPNPTSLSLQTGESYDIKEELPELLAHIVSLYDPIRTGDRDAYAKLDELYLGMMYRMGEKHFFIDTLTGERFAGIIRGHDTNACLLVENEKGEVKSFAFKEISYVL